jgi:hypothetical protein
MSEPLAPLLDAITHEIGRLERELEVTLGVARIDAAAGTVVIEGDGLRNWGPRTMLEGRLTRCGLDYETRAPGMRIIVTPN